MTSSFLYGGIASIFIKRGVIGFASQNLDESEKSREMTWIGRVINVIYPEKFAIFSTFLNGGMVGIGVYLFLIPLIIKLKEFNQSVVYYVK